MSIAQSPTGTLRASLFEIERGLFFASYRDIAAAADSTNPQRQRMPIYQVACSASDARAKIERCAWESGYSGVEWEDLASDPVVPATGRGRAPDGATTPLY